MSNPFTKNHFEKLKDLASDKSITVCRPDKGRGVVILDKTDYNDKMNTILQYAPSLSSMASEQERLNHLAEVVDLLL